MSKTSTQYSSTWKGNSVLVELSRTIKRPNSGELLFSVPAILSVLEESNAGQAADDLCMLLDDKTILELREDMFPDCQTACESHFEDKPTPKTEKKPVKLVRDLLEIKELLKAEGTKSSSSSNNQRTTRLSLGMRISRKQNGKRRPKNKARFNRRSRSIARNSGASSVGSGESVGSAESRVVTNVEYTEFIKGDTVLSLLKEYSTLDLQVVLTFLLSKYHNGDGLLPTRKTDFWIELASSPMFSSRRHMFNHIASGFREISTLKGFRILVLDEIVTFIWRNSLRKSSCSSIFGPLLFIAGEESNTDRAVAAGKLFNRIVYSAEILFPPSNYANGRHRIWFDTRKLQKFNNEEIVDTSYYQKNQLINFYKRLNENKYILIVDQLFELYRFKDIVMGIFNKYDYIIEDWKEMIRVDLTAGDLANLDLTESKNIMEVKDFRARDHKGSGYFDIIDDEMESKMNATVRTIENTLLNEEIDFNEKLLALQDKYLPSLDKHCQKQKEQVFGDAFKSVVEASTQLAVSLEVLNLVRKPVKNSLNDMSSASLMKQLHPNPHQRRYQQEAASKKSRVSILCDIYLDHLEIMYHGYAPFIIALDDSKTLVEEKQGNGMGSFRSFMGSVRGSARVNSNTGRRTERETRPTQVPERPTSRPIQARGKLRGEDRQNNNNLLGTKRDTRGKKSNKKTGSIVNMRRPRRDLHSYFQKFKENFECFDSSESLLDVLLLPESRFKKIEEAFKRLKRHADKNSVLAEKSGEIVRIVKELQKSISQDRRATEQVKRNFGEEEVLKNKVNTKRVFVEV